MRNLNPLEALFPGIRRGVLAALYLQPEKWWYLSELAQYLGTTPSSLQRELAALESSGIVEKRREGTRVYYRANRESPVYPEMERLFEKTEGVAAVLQHMLAPFEQRIVCAFVYGSIARRTEHAGSDVDLLIVGEVRLGDLAPGLRKAEKKLGREVNVMLYSVADLRARIREQDHFLGSVLRHSKQFLKGDRRELEKIAGPQGRPAA
jgi:predicted nucleotidyltransferase